MIAGEVVMVVGDGSETLAFGLAMDIHHIVVSFNSSEPSIRPEGRGYCFGPVQTRMGDERACTEGDMFDADFGKGVLVMGTNTTVCDSLLGLSDVVGESAFGEAPIVGVVGGDGDSHRFCTAFDVFLAGKSFGGAQRCLKVNHLKTRGSINIQRCADKPTMHETATCLGYKTGLRAFNVVNVKSSARNGVEMLAKRRMLLGGTPRSTMLFAVEASTTEW